MCAGSTCSEDATRHYVRDKHRHVYTPNILVVENRGKVWKEAHRDLASAGASGGGRSLGVKVRSAAAALVVVVWECDRSALEVV